jgi:hypothetical protein
MLQDTADASYAVLLHALDYVFQQDTHQRGELLEAARRGMYNIDAACRLLSERNAGAMFKIPAAPAAGRKGRTAHGVGDPLRPQFQRLRKSGHRELVNLADRMESKLADLTSSLDAAKTA